MNVVIERSQDRREAFGQPDHIGGFGWNGDPKLLIVNCSCLFEMFSRIAKVQDRRGRLSADLIGKRAHHPGDRPFKGDARLGDRCGKVLEGLLRQVLRRGNLHQQQECG